MERERRRKRAAIAWKALLFVVSLGALCIVYALPDGLERVLSPPPVEDREALCSFFEVRADRADPSFSERCRKLEEESVPFVFLPARAAVGRRILVCYKDRTLPVICEVCGIGPHAADAYWDRFVPEPAGPGPFRCGIALSTETRYLLGIPEDEENPLVMWRFFDHY